MVDSSSYGFSVLERNSPISKDGIRSVSTPISKYNNDNDNLSPVDITDMLSAKNFASNNVSTPNRSLSPKKNGLQSILKNGSNSNRKDKSSNNVKNETQDFSITESLLRKHPELNYASRNGDLNPVKCARVIFSPTKEILSYRKEYLDDVSNSELESNTSYNSRTRSRINKDKNRGSSGLDLTNESESNLHLNLNEEKVRKNNNEFGESSENRKQSFAAQLVTDPAIPYVLSLYLQLFFNLLLISIVLYFVFIFIKTIRADINHKLEVYISNAFAEIAKCERAYQRNNCNRRAPLLEAKCTEWEKCMNSDPQLIGKSKITAETFADIVNGFIRPISWKSLVFLVCLIFGSLLVTNLAFGSYRNSSSHMRSKDAKKLEELENRLKQQATLLSKYQMQDILQEQSEPPRDFSRLQSPHSQMVVRSSASSYLTANDTSNTNNNSTFNSSPLLQRRQK
ncbi:predicted protein [Scheffersomyces stipitis CBS 6054]|uniref:Brl1/Brr6 domain-containing protein n=1 Tax=Scheffersomyces stipitis (strain ATCC 58785 / CBS 6054 / NBRC 10063 / NRRL Y-11545) TaxID=322104 RepID=A3LQ35_PICST|nr:predicted protein [Scheffersomyces stipitis CBS 6054]ABN65144.2 predicted protein [Scheffersomyces stipitis CBS 6054]